MIRSRPMLAVTLGDPLGIGPEIVLKCLERPIEGVDIFVIGHLDALQSAQSTVSTIRKLRRIDAPEDASQHRDTINVLEHGTLPRDLTLGQIDARAGRASYEYVVHAIDLACTQRIDAIVTAPIHKQAWQAAGITYPGHTELLAAKSGIDDFAMMLFNDELRVILVSIHVPLRAAIEHVTVERELQIIRLAHKAIRDMGIARPRVAVAGLNPHAGDGGLFGTEDQDIIAPAIAQARAEGIDASGPWSGDTVFMQARQGKFDIVVAQYHDQGLIPLKYMGLDKGVNATVGLPFVRTSVDHGTAFDIAGRGIADASSLSVAIAQAVRMTRARHPA